MAVTLRPLDEQERAAIQRLARSRTEAARLVERARMVLKASEGASLIQIAAELEVDPRTVESWLRRFNEQGLAGLQDRPRSGRPVTYPAEVVGEVIAASLTHPRELGLPFGCWSVRRLETYLNEERNLSIKRSRIDELLLAEGLRWRSQETWFGERAVADFAATASATNAESATQSPIVASGTPRLDPEFARKRGP
jgi:transposase